LNLQYPNADKQLKFEYRMHIGEDLLKYEKTAKNKEIVGLLNYADILKDKIDFFLDKQELFLTKNEVVFRVN